jgi:hypothetical protein
MSDGPPWGLIALGALAGVGVTALIPSCNPVNLNGRGLPASPPPIERSVTPAGPAEGQTVTCPANAASACLPGEVVTHCVWSGGRAHANCRG